MINSDNTYKERKKFTGKKSEEYCEEWLDSFENVFWRKLGWDFEEDKNPVNLIPLNKFYKLPKMIQKLPDYIVIGKYPYFIESKGCNTHLHLKLNDYEQYKKWNRIMPLNFYIYNYATKSHKLISWKQMKNEYIPMSEETYFEVDGKEIYKIYIGS